VGGLRHPVVDLLQLDHKPVPGVDFMNQFSAEIYGQNFQLQACKFSYAAKSNNFLVQFSVHKNLPAKVSAETDS
jgi:hypothetical protein